MKKQEKIGFLKTLDIASRALAVSMKTRGPLSMAVGIAGFAAAFLPVLISSTLAHFTDSVQHLSQGQAVAAAALGSLGILVGLYLVQTLYTSLQTYCADADSFNIGMFITKTIIACTARVEYKYIENEGDFREKLLFAEQDGGNRVGESMQQVILALQNLIAFVSIVVMLLRVSSWIVLILLVTCIPAVVLSMLQKDDEYKNKSKGMLEGAMSVHLFYIGAGANEHCRSMADLRFCNIYPWVKKKWRTVSDGYLKKKNKMTRKHVLYNSLADILRNAVYIGVLLLTAKRIFEKPSLGLGVFMLVFTLSGQLQSITTKLFVGVARFFGDIRYMKDFFDLEDTPKEPLEKNPRAFESVDIRFDNVHFTYPNSGREALRGVSVTIRQGEKLAIVGENGSGKSTFINLLCGIYEPTAGKVTVGGFNVRENLRAVRMAISVVFQSFGRYETTIRENITISDGRKSPSEGELDRILTNTGAASFVAEQPHGLDEEVGLFSKSGNNLSGGQWQKIALSRAVYRDKARVMVLDEPTAALDPLAEAQLYRDFAKLTGDKTTMLISHRLGITSVVDRVLVFDEGRIVEDGSHAELLSKDGLYAKMYRAQAQWYAEELEV